MRMLAYAHDKRGTDGFHLITSVFSCGFCLEPEEDHGFHKPRSCHVVHSMGWLRFQWRCISSSGRGALCAGQSTSLACFRFSSGRLNLLNADQHVLLAVYWVLAAAFNSWLTKP